jgi:hypothetical protein
MGIDPGLFTKSDPGNVGWRDGLARANQLRQFAEMMASQSELVHFLTRHACGADDARPHSHSRWRAPKRVLKVGHFKRAQMGHSS